VPAQAATPAEILAAYAKKAGAPGVPERGQKLFNQDFNRDFPGCSACHGAVPVKAGKDLVSDKAIEPLAPQANAKRFVDATRVELKFKLNCMDVVGRECTAQEKADIMSWLLTLKP
jgi:mono/diheme cytochrome c family protein